MARPGIFSLIVIVTSLGMPLTACTGLDKAPRIHHRALIAADPAVAITGPAATATIKVAALNLAHGRKDSFNQFFLSREAIRSNLEDIARLLKQQQPDIVALQEADAPSLWSGDFNHVDYLARRARYPWHVHAINVNSWYSSFGTALLSRLPLQEGIEYTFEPSPPTLNKGFVLASIRWPAGDGHDSRIVDIISVHLDFSRRSVRDRQINEMRQLLSGRMNPTIILGDFNSEWLQESSAIRALTTKSRFTAFQPESKAYNSYRDRRLDWILVTRDMEFVSYRVLPDILSDHLMITAEIRFKPRTNGTQNAQQ